MSINLNSVTVHLFSQLIRSKNLLGSSVRQFSLTNKRNMRYVQYKNKNGGNQYLGAQLSIGGDIVDISSVDSSIPNNLVDFLKLGQSTYEKARR